MAADKKDSATHTGKPTAYNRVAALRRAEGISRKQMAREIGISPETLSYIERAEREPGVLLAWRIARYFDLPLELVFSDEPLPTLLQILKDTYSGSQAPASEHSRTSSQGGRGVNGL